MPLQQIREQILKEAEEKAKAIEDSGRRESDDIVRDASAQAKKIYEKARAAARQWADIFVVEHEAEFKIDRHNALLSAQEEAIEANINQIIRAITSELLKSYGKIVDGAVRALEKSTLMEKKDFVIRCEPKYLRLVKSSGIETEAAKRGIRLETIDGSVSVDIAPDAIINRNIDSVRMALVRELFGGNIALERKMEREEKKAEQNVEKKLEEKAEKKEKIASKKGRGKERRKR
ncbi:MAG: hypothetical protein LVQ95_03210 [Candidatus Micrarchaeales archaeon]|nr:hypothetical protein [Candidatus Micrarchaeales archaeon]